MYYNILNVRHPRQNKPISPSLVRQLFTPYYLLVPHELPILKGRGAVVSPANRFQPLDYVRDEDVQDDEPQPAPRTQFYIEPARSILVTNDSPDVGFDVGINVYRGCEHGCMYCFARPTHEYLDLNAGIDFESKIFVKMEAAKLLRKELSSARWKPRTIGMSGVTDCYQPIERKLKLTRGCLEVLADFRNPVTIITKNHLVTRDIDLLIELAKYKCVAVNVSVTTLDQELTMKMEPRTSVPRRRLDAVRKLSDAGVPVGVLIAPVIPGLTDHEVPNIVKAVADAGAKWAHAIPVRLPGAVLPIFENWLEAHFPDRKQKIMNRIKELRGGKMYDSRFHHRMRGQGEMYEQMKKMAELHIRKYGLNVEGAELSAENFRRVEAGQMNLFDS